MGKIKKEKTQTNKKEIIFQIVNSILVVGILAFYFGRMFYYKKYYEQRQLDSLGELSLAEMLIEKSSLTTVTDGLVKQDNGSYLYKGYVSNNYLIYDNILFRIIGIDCDDNIRIVSEDSLINFYLKQDTNFMESSLNTYLNPKAEEKYSGFYVDKTLLNANYIILNTTCIDKIDRVDKIGCDFVYDEQYVGMLSLNDYKNAGGGASYLNNNDDFWLANTNEKGQYWFVDGKGNVSISESVIVPHGVRPVLTLSYSVKQTSGDGSKNNPFIISQKKIETVADLHTGQYVSYSNKIWQVSLRQEAGTVIMLDGVLQHQENFGKKPDFTIKSGVGKYLNKTFIKELNDYKKYLIEYDWPSGKFVDTTDNDYRSNYNSFAKFYVGLPNTSYPGFDKYDDCFLLTHPYESDRIVYTIKDGGILYAVLLAEKKNIRPVVCLNNTIKIVAGDGSIENPFVLEGELNEGQ